MSESMSCRIGNVGLYCWRWLVLGSCVGKGGLIEDSYLDRTRPRFITCRPFCAARSLYVS